MILTAPGDHIMNPSWSFLHEITREGFFMAVNLAVIQSQLAGRKNVQNCKN